MNRVRLIVCVLGLLACGAAAAQEFDTVIRNGRVMDPESGLDAVRQVGISRGKILAISTEPLKGKRIIDATGLVVAPGFIDLHQHAWDEQSQHFKIRDGVTSVLELEVGTGDVDKWYQKWKGKLPFNYGVSVGHIPVRMKVMGDFPSFLPKSDAKAATVIASVEQLELLRKGIARGLDQGAVAVGFGIAYTPAASQWEILEMFRVAAKYDAACHVHIRERRERSVLGVQEVLADSVISGAPLHLVHVQATGAKESPALLQMVSEARAQGCDVTAEVYPYTAGMTDIKSSIFAEGWQETFEIGYDQLQWGETGEKLNEETFRKYRKTGGLVIVHLNSENVVTNAVKHPVAMIASDGLEGHPRNAGTFARILGFYVREQGELSLMEALRKISLMPAMRLEQRVPSMKNKGRVRIGADADLTIFSPNTVTDLATYSSAKKSSEGIPYVLVGGTLVVKDGKIVEGKFPGKAIRAIRAVRR